ncbi:MAG: flagellar hook-basal body complex protein FliE [Syntrophomonadaceae bacterium]|nr:flagellar hook-basal body complex protein FliE [Syntrophomonadaceae bacterium]
MVDQSWFKVGGNDVQTGDGISFSGFLKDALDQVESTQAEARLSAASMVVGDSAQMHQVMIAYEKAYMALDLTIQIRNKMVEAYQEIMRIQI